VAAGKKLRCPECKTVFAPKGERAAKATGAAAQPAPAAAAAPAIDPDEGGSYGVVKDEHDQAAMDRQKAAFDPIKDRFKRSARGPALVHVVRPSTWLLGTGVLICIAALVGALWAVFPMIFKVEEVQPEDPNAKWRPQAQEGRRFQEMSPEEYKERWMYFGGFVLHFLWGAAVCNGASKMHTLDSYAWAMTASIMVLNGPGTPFGGALLVDSINKNDAYMTFVSMLLLTLPGVPVSMWCLAVLRNKEVIAGFAEEKPDDVF
jgi:hypothetical protein